MVMEIGSGEYPRGIDLGFWHSDIRYPLPHQEICFDMSFLPFKANSLDGLALYHSLEHIGWREVPILLRKLCDVLKPGGFLEIVCPNLNWCAVEILSLRVCEDCFESRWDNLIQELYSAQNFDENYHKSGFTPKHLGRLLIEAGFRSVNDLQGEFSGNVGVRAFK